MGTFGSVIGVISILASLILLMVGEGCFAVSTVNIARAVSQSLDLAKQAAW